MCPSDERRGAPEESNAPFMNSGATNELSHADSHAAEPLLPNLTFSPSPPKIHSSRGAVAQLAERRVDELRYNLIYVKAEES